MIPRRMEGFFLLALAAHLLLFSVLSVSPGQVEPSFIREKGQERKSAGMKPEDSGEKVRRKPDSKARPRRDDEPVTVIPLVPDPDRRWIVELADIPREEEPEKARYVSERPSRVEEELRAEHTSREPKKAGGKAGRGGRAASGAGRSGERMAGPGKAPAGIDAGERGDIKARRGRDDEVRNPRLGETGLFPTFRDLARDVPSPGEGYRTETKESGEGRGDEPGTPSAPENFLPLVKKRGNITLLNSKSYKYAGFVRRVAQRIFDQFVIGFDPREFSGGDYTLMSGGATLEAIMNPAGRTVNIMHHRDSGSDNFDSLAHSAVQEGAWDTNVPAGAECPDGFVHFVFIPRIIPARPAYTGDGSRVYTEFYLMAIAGIKECE